VQVEREGDGELGKERREGQLNGRKSKLTILTCFQNPTKNPVPTSDKIVPTA